MQQRKRLDQIILNPLWVYLLHVLHKFFGSVRLLFTVVESPIANECMVYIPFWLMRSFQSTLSRAKRGMRWNTRQQPSSRASHFRWNSSTESNALIWIDWYRKCSDSETNELFDSVMMDEDGPNFIVLRAVAQTRKLNHRRAYSWSHLLLGAVKQQ